MKKEQNRRAALSGLICLLSGSKNGFLGYSDMMQSDADGILLRDHIAYFEKCGILEKKKNKRKSIFIKWKIKPDRFTALLRDN